MAPIFETVKSFADIKVIDDGVPTADFLEASDGLVAMFNLLGIGIFSFVKHDIETNIHGVRASYTSKPDERETLEQLVHSENGEHGKHGIHCLRRLLRGLLFTCRALQEARASPHENLMKPSFSRAYDNVLRPHHNRAIRFVVQNALRACPTRADFFTRIADGGDQGKLDEELRKWLDGLETILTRMCKFYAEQGHGNV